jgi:hypothetical protein
VPVNERPIFLSTIILLVVLASIGTTMQRTAGADAILQQTCVPYTGGAWGTPGTITLADNFGLQSVYAPANDPTSQGCVHTFASGTYGWNFTKPNTTYNWMYPAQIDVRMFGMPVAGLTTAEVDFSAAAQITSPASSTVMDLSWDMYLYTGSTLVDEVMIGMLWSNQTTTNCSQYVFGCQWAAGFSFGSFSDGYNTYGLYEYTNTVQQSLHQFRILGGQRIPTRINLLAFIQFLQKLGRTPTYIGSIDLGSEVWQGSGSVQVNSYSLRLGGSSSTTTFVGPASTTASSTSSLVTTSSSTRTSTSSTTSLTTASSTSSLVTTSSWTRTTTSSTMTTTSSSRTTTSSTTSSTTSLTSASKTTTTVHPSISLNPSTNSVGSTVDVSGSAFSPSDTACSISGSVAATPTCSVSGGVLTGAFTVANVAAGSYSVTATGTQAGDSASTSFTVPSPSITLNPTSAYVGASVGMTGEYFPKADSSCSLSGNPVAAFTCTISNGTLSATFNVTSISAGTYTVTATGSPGGDSASASFVVKRASLVFNPALARAGSNVTVSGVGFFLSDTSCTLSGSSVASQSCSLSAGKLSGFFIVANVTTGNGAAASYTVTATGSPAGDSTSATFTITTPARTITLNPFYASVGSTVRVNGSGFSSSDSTCALSGGAITSQTCSITDGLITATFTVGDVPAGGYTVTVTGEPVGDSATADFTVTSASLSIVLNPTSGLAGATVHVSGSGFLSSDSSCTLSGSIVSSPSCSISSGTLSGSFIATNVTSGSYVVTAIGSPNMDVVSAPFSVTVPLTSETTTISSSSSSTVALPDFSLTATPFVTVTQGETTSATVVVGSINGFSSAVTLSALWVGTPPVGVGLSIASPIIPAPYGTEPASLTIISSPLASIGTFTVQVKGTSGSLTHVSSNIAVQLVQPVTITSTSSISGVSSTTTSSLSSATTSVTTSPHPLPSVCPVATATSGFALAPLAQGLRSYRDQSIMKTRTGVSFMTLFNAWYYSFSPPLASYLETHQTQRVVFGYALYPLIGLLYASYYTYALISPVNNEVAAIAAGLVAAAMIGFVYLAPPLYLAERVLRRKITTSSRLSRKRLLALSVASSVAIGFSYSSGITLALGFAAASLLLSVLTFGVNAGIQALRRVKLTYLSQPLALLREVCKVSTMGSMTWPRRQAAAAET